MQSTLRLFDAAPLGHPGCFGWPHASPLLVRVGPVKPQSIGEHDEVNIDNRKRCHGTPLSPRCLQASNYSVVEAESDAQGLQAAAREKYRRHRARLHGNPGGRLENVEKAAHRSSNSRDPGNCDEQRQPVWLRLASSGQCLACEAVPAQPAHSGKKYKDSRPELCRLCLQINIRRRR
jgi:hypothetical protein